jgi:hypothetical protein
VSLRIPSSSRSPDHDRHSTIYYLGYPLSRFASLKHRQLARQVGVIITTGRIRRTFTSKINLHGSQSGADSISCCAQCSRVEVAYFQFDDTSLCSSDRSQSALCLHNRTRRDQHRSRDGQAEHSSISKQVKCEYYSQFAGSAGRLLGSKSRQNQTPSRNQKPSTSICVGQETSLICCVHFLIFLLWQIKNCKEQRHGRT